MNLLSQEDQDRLKEIPLEALLDAIGERVRLFSRVVQRH